MSEFINRDSLLECVRKEMAEIDAKKIKAIQDGDYLTRLGCDAMYRAYQRVLDITIKKVACIYIEKPGKTTKGNWAFSSCTYDRVPCETVYYCDKCNHKIIVIGGGTPWENFCPACGADMREG